MYYREAAGLVANRMYANVKTFSGGMKAWQAAGYPVVTTNKLPEVDVESIDAATFKTEFHNYCVVDIRARKLYRLGLYTRHLGREMAGLSSDHRKKYIHKIPLPHLTRLYEKIPRDKTIVVVDHKGQQSFLAARFLRNNGYIRVCVLKGGLMSFEK